MRLQNIRYHYDASKGEPKYLQFSKALEQWLRMGNFKFGEKFPSDRQLADYFQLGTLTVTRSVNELVERGLLKRRVGSGTYLTECAHEDKWPQTRRIGLVCHDVMRDDGFFITVALHALQEEASAHQLDLISLVRTPEQYEATIHEYNLGAMLVLAPQESFLPQLQKLSLAGFPVATLGAYFQEIAAFSFGTEHAETAAMTVDYLYKRGCTKIGIVVCAFSSTQPEYSVRAREHGYMEGMWRNRLPVNPQWVFHKNIGEDKKFEEQFKGVFSSPEGGPNALLILSLPDSLIIYKALQDLHKSIPKDVSLVAFDDSEYARFLNPSLTVWEQNTDRSARHAINYLTELLEKREVTPHSSTHPTLLERNSTK